LFEIPLVVNTYMANMIDTMIEMKQLIISGFDTKTYS